MTAHTEAAVLMEDRIRFSMTRDEDMTGMWNEKTRAELRYTDDDNAPMGSSRIYEFEHIVPESWQFGDGTERNVIFDVHNWETHESGSMPFQVFIVGDEYWFATNPMNQANWNIVVQRKIIRGVKTRFKLEATWSPDENGMMRLYRNGQMIWEQIGTPSCYPENIIPYPKIGLYCTAWPAGIHSRCIDVTDFQVGPLVEGIPG